MSQALLNLVVNASHAIGKREDAEKGEITVRTARTGDSVRIDVSDNGCGIPEEIQARVFDPFFTTKDVGKGTGQGLALVHKVVVDQHGGKASVESTVGVGTTFTIEIPIAPPDMPE